MRGILGLRAGDPFEFQSDVMCALPSLVGILVQACPNQAVEGLGHRERGSGCEPDNFGIDHFAFKWLSLRHITAWGFLSVDARSKPRRSA